MLQPREDFVVLRQGDWHHAVAASDLPQKLKELALVIAWHAPGKQLTGRGVQIDRAWVAELLDVSVRTIERRVAQFKGSRYLAQTLTARPGRAAEYNLCGPSRYQASVTASSPPTQGTSVANPDPRSLATKRPRYVVRSKADVGRDELDACLPNVRDHQTSSALTSDKDASASGRAEQQEQLQSPKQSDSSSWPLGTRKAELDNTSGIDRVIRELHQFANAPMESVAGEVAARLADGWTVETLVDAVTGDTLSGARSPTAVMASRLQRLGGPAKRLPPKCDDCDESRMLAVDDRTVRRCPTCGSP